MRKLLPLLLMIALLLFGCGREPENPVSTKDTSGVTEVSVATEPRTPWIYEIGTPWDLEGKLLEIPLTIPGGMQYTSAEEIEGDLLFYSTDRHLEGNIQKELCILDLDTGRILGQKDIPCGDFAAVQVLKDFIFILSDDVQQISQYDKSLREIDCWTLNAPDSTWYMGFGNQLYRYEWEGEVLITDLNTGDTRPLLPENPYVVDFIPDGDQVRISYIQDDTGDYGWASLDLLTGDLSYFDRTGDYFDVVRGEDFWLYSTYWDDYTWYLSRDNGETLWLPETLSSLRLLEDGRLLMVSEDGNCLDLFDSQGNSIAHCRIAYESYEYYLKDIIPSKTFGGYFLVLEGYIGDFRLLHWDTSVGTPGESIPWEPVPQPSEVQQTLEQKAQALEEKYGVVILVGEQCDTVFDSFTADWATDFELVSHGLQVLDNALGEYPEGFFRQLREGERHSIRIQLISELWADGEGRYGDGYIAFTQNMWDHYLMVVDIDDSDESTYYHEISHIIDSHLQWDSYQREDAVFSEEGWNALNPAWFEDYTYDYSQELAILGEGWFVDGYATISPTEDRAQVMESAMCYYEWDVFTDHYGLMQKLKYYSRCIRDAFDTTGWPEVLPWEEPLNQ